MRAQSTAEPEANDTHHLQGTARLLADVIAKIVGQDCWTGGCRTFSSPEEWKARGEEYGTDSALIVVYDGGDVRSWFDDRNGGVKREQRMQAELEKRGFYSQICTGWYSAIYPRKSS